MPSMGVLRLSPLFWLTATLGEEPVHRAGYVRYRLQAAADAVPFDQDTFLFELIKMLLQKAQLLGVRSGQSS